MAKKITEFLLLFLLTAFSAALSSLAFPGMLSEKGYGLLIFISYIPVFLIINRSPYKTVWLYGLEYGFIFYLIYNYWLKTFHPLAILIAPILESLQYAVLFPLLKTGQTVLRRKYGYILQSLVLTSYYYITLQGFLGYPYGTPSSALYLYPVLLQSASAFGLWLITLLIITPQAMIAEMISKRKPYKADALVYASLFMLNAAYGLMAMSSFEHRDADRTIRAAAVQHSADSWQGGYSTYKKNFETLSELSLKAMEENPDLVVWSETAFVPSVRWHQAYPSSRITSQLVEDFVSFGKNLGVPLITGNPEGLIKDDTLPAFLPDGSWNWKTYNTVILFGDGDVLGTYRKQHLVPFTEHFPYERQLPKLYALLLANDYKWWEEGNEMTVFSYDGLSFSTPICFEDTFGYLSAGFVRNGADLLINLTNDSWSGSVEAEMQHMQLAAMRAIETRRPLLRSTNSGITCLITEDGRIHNMLQPFTEAYGIYDIDIGKYSGLTLYSRYPDILAKAIVLATPIIYAAIIIFRIRRKREEEINTRLAMYNAMFESIAEDTEC